MAKRVRRASATIKSGANLGFEAQLWQSANAGGDPPVRLNADPGRYVGAEVQEEDDEPFAEKIQRLVAQLRE